MISYREDTCPFCDSANLGYEDQTNEGPYGLEITVFCHDCYEDWVEIAEDDYQES